MSKFINCLLSFIEDKLLTAHLHTRVSLSVHVRIHFVPYSESSRGPRYQYCTDNETLVYLGIVPHLRPLRGVNVK